MHTYLRAAVRSVDTVPSSEVDLHPLRGGVPPYSHSATFPTLGALCVPAMCRRRKAYTFRMSTGGRCLSQTRTNGKYLQVHL